jgi:hypothetical protein
MRSSRAISLMLPVLPESAAWWTASSSSSARERESTSSTASSSSLTVQNVYELHHWINKWPGSRTSRYICALRLHCYLPAFEKCTIQLEGVLRHNYILKFNIAQPEKMKYWLLNFCPYFGTQVSGYLPFRLLRQLILQYCYRVHLAIAISKELLYLLFVCTKMHVLHKDTALVTIFLGIGRCGLLGGFNLLFVCAFGSTLTLRIIRFLLLFVIFLFLFFVRFFSAL